MTSDHDADVTNQNIKEGIQGHAAGWYSDVFDLVFADVDVDKANGLWTSQLARKDKEREKGEDDD